MSDNEIRERMAKKAEEMAERNRASKALDESDRFLRNVEVAGLVFRAVLALGVITLIVWGITK